METPLSVHPLHALAYCERLFFLEEVERLRVANESVYAGRTLHAEIGRREDDEIVTLNLESEQYGLIGKVDCLRRQNGEVIPYEHKRGRAARNSEGKPEAWASDRLQIIAYCLLVEEHLSCKITEGRVRYHADNATVRVEIDDQARTDFAKHLAKARELQAAVERPPVTDNEKLCVKCSLAPVCLPEETRLAVSYIGAWTSGQGSVQRRIRQYRALTNEQFCFALAKRLVEAKVRSQLSFLLRASRDAGREIADVKNAILGIRKLLSPLNRSENPESLRGYEGSILSSKFVCWKKNGQINLLRPTLLPNRKDFLPAFACGNRGLLKNNL
jgi:CRISPR-associated protein Cas4